MAGIVEAAVQLIPGAAEASISLVTGWKEIDSQVASGLYGLEPDAFDAESEQIGLLVAAHAAVAFADSQRISQLNEALVTRQLIGQAESILMERYKINAQQAFLVLTRASSRSNTKLPEVAEHLNSSGEIETAKRPRDDRYRPRLSVTNRSFAILCIT